LISSTGSVAETYLYHAYGLPIIFTGAGSGNWWDADETTSATSAKGLVYLFTGRELDSLDTNALKLYYYRARTYSPTLGRFIQRDPIGYVDGMNLYEYVRSTPVNKIDFLGLAGLQGNSSPSIISADSAAFPALPGYQEGVPNPLPPGGLVEVIIKGEEQPCGYIVPTGLTNCHASFTWKDLFGGGCLLFKLIVGDDPCKTTQGKIKGLKPGYGYGLPPCPPGYECRNKARFNGTYPVTLTLNKMILYVPRTTLKACELSGTMTGTLTAQGELGGCFGCPKKN
jgi:RHS repeat-associated protein